MLKKELEPRPCDGLLIKQVSGQGTGVFTRYPIRNGEQVLFFTGKLTPAKLISDFTHFIQVSPDSYLGPSGSFDDFVNHHCEPNCTVAFEGDELVLIAIRHIEENEQLSFDYGTIMFNEPTSFTCECGAVTCRGLISNFFTLSKEQQAYFVTNKRVALLSKFTPTQLGITDTLQ